MRTFDPDRDYVAELVAEAQRRNPNPLPSLEEILREDEADQVRRRFAQRLRVRNLILDFAGIVVGVAVGVAVGIPASAVALYLFRM